jgi:hypothetical protein
MSAKKATIESRALAVRDAALAEYNEVQNNPDVYDGCDPGDAEVTLEGNGWNVLTVLNLLKVLGVPGCTPKRSAKR